MIAQHASEHYNRSVSPSVFVHLSINSKCKCSELLNHKVYFEEILHTYMYACQHCITTGMRNILFLKDEPLPSISPASRGQLLKMLITLKPHSILGSNLAFLYILTFSSHW